MIQVPSPINEPADFNAQCRIRGQAWLANNPAPKRPFDYWSPFRDLLAEGFNWRCGYKAMHNAEGTIDHFISCDTDRNQAYEWNNYRYISGTINSSKQTLDDDVLDPFEIQDDWFRVILPSLELVLTDAVPQPIRARAGYTLQRLRLDRGHNVLRRRNFWYRQHSVGGLPIPLLEVYAPLVARAIQEWIRVRGLPLPDIAPFN